MSILSLPSQLGGGTRYSGAAAPPSPNKVDLHVKVDLQKLYGKDSVLLSNYAQANIEHPLESARFTTSMVQQAHAADVSEALQELFDDLAKAGKKAKRHEQAAQNKHPNKAQLFKAPVSFIV